MRKKKSAPGGPSLFDGVLDKMQQEAHAPRSVKRLNDDPPVTPDPTPAERRDAGIKHATEHADKVKPKWSTQADIYTRNWLRRHGDAPFLMEEVVEDAKREGFPNPPDKRAFGGVIRRLAKDKAVLKEGVGAAKTSNLSLKVLWRRNPDWIFS